MSRACSICNNPNRNEIENAILEGQSPLAVGMKYGLSRTAIWRHRTNHMAAEAQEASALAVQGRLPLNVAIGEEKAARLTKHLDLRDELLRLHGEADEIRAKAKDGDEGLLALQAIDRVLNIVDEMVKYSLLTYEIERDEAERRLLTPGLEELTSKVASA